MTFGRKYPDGETNSSEYRAWHSLKGRCLNPTDKSYARYGGRGITVDPRWVESYDAFFEDMGRKPSPIHSLDRIDTDGPYSKENCRWATAVQQQNNRSTNRILTINGISRTVVEWARINSIPRGVIAARLFKGWSDCDAVTRAVRRMSGGWKRLPGHVIANQYARKTVQGGAQ